MFRFEMNRTGSVTEKERGRERERRQREVETKQERIGKQLQRMGKEIFTSFFFFIPL